MDLEPSAQPLILRADVVPQRPGRRLFLPAEIAVVLQGLHHDCSNVMGSHMSHFSFWQRWHLEPGEGNGTPLQYACLENPMDGGAWWAAVHGVAKSQTQLSDFTFMHWRRKWQPTPVFLPGESQGWGSCWAAVYGVTQSQTRLKRLSSSSSSTWSQLVHLVRWISWADVC